MRSGQIKKLPRSETHSSIPKINFTAQDDGASFPGGISSKPSSSSQTPYTDAPPAYTVSEATEMVGGSGGPGGHLAHVVHEQDNELKRRKVPPPPASK